MNTIDNINHIFNNHQEEFLNAYNHGYPDSVSDALDNLRADLKPFFSALPPETLRKLQEAEQNFSFKLRAHAEDRERAQYLNRYDHYRQNICELFDDN